MLFKNFHKNIFDYNNVNNEKNSEKQERGNQQIFFIWVAKISDTFK